MAVSTGGLAGVEAGTLMPEMARQRMYCTPERPTIPTVPVPAASRVLSAPRLDSSIRTAKGLSVTDAVILSPLAWCMTSRPLLSKVF